MQRLVTEAEAKLKIQALNETATLLNTTD